MTVTYTHEVANARLGGFSNLLLRWRGSVYKLFYKEFIIYITLYIIISMTYRWIDHPDFRTYFEKLCMQFQSYTDLVPISFVLGFYVSIIITRWWQQYENIPWPDRIMIIVAANVHGPDNRGRLIRRTLVRYLSLAQVLTYRSISTAVFKRFPTIQHVIDAGFMTQTEYKQYENVKTDNVKYFVPCVWFSNLLSKVRQEGRIYDDMTYQYILKELNDFRGNCGMLFSYDWISIPLVYTQVVTVAVYVFFMSTLLSRQYLDVTKGYPGHEVDLYVPIFTICQFFFYVGWLKVAEQLINPFGEDDDDFEVNTIIDRNWEVSMLAVDNMYLSHPKLEKDIYWNNPNPAIPYTAAAANHKLDAFLGSTYDMSLDMNAMQFVERTEALPKDNKHQLDINHNNIVTEKPTTVQETPFVPGKSPPTKINNPVNFWKRLTGRAQESEAKTSLLGMDFASSRHYPAVQEKSVVKRENEEGETDTLFPTPDSDDDDDSDVGDSSSDDGSDANHILRRSSLSSEEENNNKDDNDVPTDSQRSLSVRKHSIAESDDRPRAKRPKKSSLLTPLSIKDIPQSKTNNSINPQRPAVLVINCSENDLKKTGNRFIFGKGKKSPKKKITTTKFIKRNIFERAQGGETEEERRNAQLRTIGLLKATKRKSVQALQRNARRANYPGNAWLRYKYPHPWRTDITSNADCTSMTSGAEDHGRTEYDSPFGSLLSFGTSIPSPRPLRFSQFGKACRIRNRDSISVSSCMTSPCANEDYSPSFAGYHGSPKTGEDFFLQSSITPSTNSISMPFTEDLRRRLLVVNTNTPSSSTAPSPTMSRAYMGLMGPHQQITYAQVGETVSDDLLIIAPSETTVQSNPWVGTLEAIGEIPRTEEQTKDEDTQDNKAAPDNKTDIEEPTAPRTLKQKATKNNLKRPNETDIAKLISYKNILRSKSCPDVPISKRSSFPPQRINDNIRLTIDVDVESSNDGNSDAELNETECLISTGIIHTNAELPIKRASVHWESECDETFTKSMTDKIPSLEMIHVDCKIPCQKENEPPDSGYNERTSLLSLQIISDVDSKQETDTSTTAGNIQKDENECANQIAGFSSNQVPTRQFSHASDLGYCSAREEMEAMAHVKSFDALSKIRDPSTCLSHRNSYNAVAESMHKFASVKSASNVNFTKVYDVKVEDGTNTESTVPESGVVSTSPKSGDVIISIA